MNIWTFPLALMALGSALAIAQHNPFIFAYIPAGVFVGKIAVWEAEFQSQRAKFGD